MPDKRIELVLACSSRAWGGLEQSVAQLARWLMEEGHTVRVLAAPDTPLLREAQKIEVDEAWKRPGKYFDFVSAWQLARMLNEWGNPPLLIAHNYDLDCAAWAYRFADGFELWYWQHMQLGLAKKGIFQRLRQSRLAGWLAPLKYLRQEAIEKTTVPAEKIHLMAPGVDTERFRHPELSQEAARQILDLPQEKTMLGLIGRLDPRKGQAFAIQALGTLPDPIHLALIGEATRDAQGPDYEQALRDLVGKLGLQTRVHFVPFQADTAPCYRALDAVLMCTEGETYGLVTVEALAAGIPVIGSQSGGTVDLLGNGAFGYLYTPGDQADFVRQVENVIQRPEDARAKALLGQAEVERTASRAVVVKTIRQLVLRQP